jgi:DNA repair ATPase RecN
MIAQLKKTVKNLYDTDYNLWLKETLKQLNEKNFDVIDWENLIEEVSDLSRRDRKKLKSLLRKLFEHLLKIKYWQSEITRNKGHWEGEIINFRKQIKDELSDSPSLKSYLQEILTECYQDGREIASKRSQLPLNIFPELPIANIEQILDDNWLP